MEEQHPPEEQQQKKGRKKNRKKGGNQQKQDQPQDGAPAPDTGPAPAPAPAPHQGRGAAQSQPPPQQGGGGRNRGDQGQGGPGQGPWRGGPGPSQDPRPGGPGPNYGPRSGGPSQGQGQGGPGQGPWRGGPGSSQDPRPGGPGPNYGPRLGGPIQGQGQGGPGQGPWKGGPGPGQDPRPGPNYGPRPGGPSQGQGQGGPSQGPRPGGPSQGQGQGGPSQGPRPGGPSQGQGQGGPSQGPRPGGPGPSQQGPIPGGQGSTQPGPSVAVEELTQKLEKFEFDPNGDPKAHPNNRAPPEKRSGAKILIETNYLPISLGNLKEALHYDVTIETENKSSKIPTKLSPFIMDKYIKKYFPGFHPAYDGSKNLYSAKPLMFDSGYHEGIVEVDENRQTPSIFKIVTKYAAKVDLKTIEPYLMTASAPHPTTALQCIDIVLRHAQQSQLIKIGRAYFNQPKNPISLGGGFELWNGVYQSAVLGWKPFLNVDIVNRAVVKRQTVMDYIREISREDFRTQPLSVETVSQLREFVKDLKVEFQIPSQAASKRTYKVNDVTDPPSRIQFVNEGENINILEYFRTVRKYNIQYPNLPCLWVGNPKGDIRICLPVELCTIVAGQVRKINVEQTTALINSSATPADVRKSKILNAVSALRYDEDETIAAFGIKIGKNMEKVEARVIPPPKLAYFGDKCEFPKQGVWRNQFFLEAKSLTNWGVLSLERVENRDIQNFITLVQGAGKTNGMTIEKPFTQIIRPQDLKTLFTKAVKDKVQLLVIVISPFRDHYSTVKQEAEIKAGVLTQCIKKTTFLRMNPNTAAMILLKVNAKLNGTNHKIHISTKPMCLRSPCMVMGADVTHPSPFSNEPSIAAVSASYDVNAYRYNIQWRIQPPKMEYIMNFQEITIIHLKHFFKYNKQFPKHIIMFRDGVSESMFHEIRNQELSSIRKACSTTNPDYKPQITYIIVQKRHHTRFFPADIRDGDKNKNAPPGTCIDTVITSKRNTDFYLLSHQSIRGTARPTRYQCIWDDGNMTDVEIEELAYYLCHLFTRCNRAVSYPAPTYYSHLGAERAKSLIKGCHINYNNLPAEQGKLQILKHLQGENPMFFV